MLQSSCVGIFSDSALVILWRQNATLWLLA